MPWWNNNCIQNVPDKLNHASLAEQQLDTIHFNCMQYPWLNSIWIHTCQWKRQQLKYILGWTATGRKSVPRWIKCVQLDNDYALNQCKQQLKWIRNNFTHKKSVNNYWVDVKISQRLSLKNMCALKQVILVCIMFCCPSPI